MKIAINVDGVLLDKTGFQYKYGQKFFKDRLQFLNESAYHFREMFNCTMEEQDKFWKKYILKYYLHTQPEKGASDFTRKLKEDNNIIYLMVSRDNITENSVSGDIYRLMFNYWLKKNNIFYDKIIYCDKENSVFEKYSACKEINFDYIIDDKISDVITLSDVGNVLVFNRVYNLGLVNYPRFYDFNQINCFLAKGKERRK